MEKLTITTPVIQRLVIVIKGGEVSYATSNNPDIEVLIHNEDSLWWTGDATAVLDAAAHGCKQVATVPTFWATSRMDTDVHKKDEFTGIDMMEKEQLASLSGIIEKSLPASHGYDKGFKDALESIALALSTTIAHAVLDSAITTALDAYTNNIDAADTVTLNLNIFDGAGNVVDGATATLTIEQLSDIVDHASQLILIRRDGQSLDNVLNELDEALSVADVIDAPMGKFLMSASFCEPVFRRVVGNPVDDADNTSVLARQKIVNPRYFDVTAQFDSVEHAIKAALAQPQPREAIKQIVNANIDFGEFGFASDLLDAFEAYEMAETKDSTRG